MSARLRFPVIPTMQPGLVVVILSLLLGLQPITTDLYLPALPGLTADFGAYTAQAQLTLTALLLAFGLSQLIWGPLSDQFSWRAALFALAIFSALRLAMVALRFEKTVTLTCRRLLPRFGVQRSVAIAGGLSLTGGSLMGVLALSGVQASWAIMLPYYLFMLAHRINQPCSQSGAVGPFPRAAGVESALNGFLIMMTAFVAGVWFWSALVALGAWTLVQKHGKTGAQ